MCLYVCLSVSHAVFIHFQLNFVIFPIVTVNDVKQPFKETSDSLTTSCVFESDV